MIESKAQFDALREAEVWTKEQSDALVDIAQAAREVVDTTSMIHPAGGMDRLELALARLEL